MTAGLLTPEFLTAVLRPTHPGARVTGCRPELLTTEHGMSATLYRLHLTGAGPSTPTSIIVKVPPTDPAVRDQLHTMGFFEREVGFYRTLAAATPIPTPVCFHADLDPLTGRAWLLLEDLAARRNGDTVAPATLSEVSAVLHSLALMHAQWWRDESISDQPATRLRGWLAPSAATEVFERAWPTFLSRCSFPVDEGVVATKEWISATLPLATSALFDAGPRTLVHNDVQADNLYFSSEPGRPVIFIDWQMATFARCVVDVANAIRGMLEPASRFGAEQPLVQLYFEALVDAGVDDYPLAQCQADYHLATVLAPARLVSAVGLRPGLGAHPGAAWNTLFPRLTAGHGGEEW